MFAADECRAAKGSRHRGHPHDPVSVQLKGRRGEGEGLGVVKANERAEMSGHLYSV